MWFGGTDVRVLDLQSTGGRSNLTSGCHTFWVQPWASCSLEVDQNFSFSLGLGIETDNKRSFGVFPYWRKRRKFSL